MAFEKVAMIERYTGGAIGQASTAESSATSKTARARVMATVAPRRDATGTLGKHFHDLLLQGVVMFVDRIGSS